MAIPPFAFVPISAELAEIDRNARAYGFEIGRGKRLAAQVDSSDDNPFLSPDWRDAIELDGIPHATS